MTNATAGNRIRLVLLDEQVLLRAGIARLLAGEFGFEVVGECGTPAEAMEMLRGITPDVVLVDFDAGVSQDGAGFMCTARTAGYRGRFLVVADTTDIVEKSALALRLGASGIFLKSEPPERLLQAIRCIADGALWLDQTVVQRLAERYVWQESPRAGEKLAADLNDRERKTLLGVLGGLTTKKIAANMGLSESSVKYILRTLFSKAGVRTRSQLVRVALQDSWGSAGHFAKGPSGGSPVAGQSSG